MNGKGSEEEILKEGRCWGHGRIHSPILRRLLRRRCSQRRVTFFSWKEAPENREDTATEVSGRRQVNWVEVVEAHDSMREDL